MSKEAATLSLLSRPSHLFRLASLVLALGVATAAPAPAFGQTANAHSSKGQSSDARSSATHSGDAKPSGPASTSTPSSTYFRFDAGASAVPNGNIAASFSAAVGKHALLSTIRGEVEAAVTWARSRCSSARTTTSARVERGRRSSAGEVRYEGRTTTKDHRPLALSGAGVGYHGTAEAQPDAPAATSSHYFGFAGGVSDMLHGDLGPNLSLAIGKPAIFSTLRGQIEASFSSSWTHPSCWYDCYLEGAYFEGRGQYGRTNVNSLSVIASLYYDFREGKAFRPFIGDGVLYQVQSATAEQGARPTAWSADGGGFQWTASVAYEIRPNWIVQASRRVLAAVGDEQQFQVGLQLRR